MQYLYAAILGIAQGLTEFLPVSSSGHLILLHRYLKIPMENELAFDVSLHLATLIAVIWFFRSEILKLFLSWLSSFKNLREGIKDMSWLIIISTIPAALAGYLFEDKIETVFRSPLIVALMMILVGLLFIVIEKIGKQTDDLNKLDWKKALVIGAFQAIALIPGTSRSGITTISGMGLKLKREEAIKYSFLLSIPVIAGATLKELPRLANKITFNEASVMIVAFIFSLFSGIIAIRYLLAYTKNHSLNAFAYYRFLVALVIIVLFI